MLGLGLECKHHVAQRRKRLVDVLGFTEPHRSLLLFRVEPCQELGGGVGEVLS